MSSLKIDREKKIHIVAERACSHDGDEQLARIIIDGAGNAGADSIQFQVWQAEDIMVPHHPNFALLKRIELGRDVWQRLAEYTLSKFPETEIVACIYDPASADFCARFGAAAFKLHSADLSNPELIRHVAQLGKRIDLSVGASSLDEVAQALDSIRKQSSCPVWLMYGYQSFPTPTDGIHLDYMRTIRDLFGLPVGYQDHSDAESQAAFWLPAAAAGMGVDAVEKHITHDRSKKGVDHEAALNPDEFTSFCGMIREIDIARGSRHPRPFSEPEIEYRKYSKKSIVAARDLPAGSQVELAELTFMRADELGLPPDRVYELTGRKTRREIPAHSIVRPEDME